MSKTLAVFGATGQQGGSVIHHVLSDPSLSKEYKIRAITRDVDSENGKRLKQQVEVVHGDVNNRASLEKALTGIHTVFIMTNPDFGPNGLQKEYNIGKAIADLAVEKGVQYIIFSTLPSIAEISNNKYTTGVHFEAKAKIERYIRSLPISSAFHSPGFFMQNFHSIPFLTPRPVGNGTWSFSLPNAPTARVPMIDSAGDTGKFIGAILAEPDRFAGKTFCSGAALYSLEQVAAIMSQATGKPVVYKQVSFQDFKDSLPFGQDIFPGTFKYWDEFGYYGADSETLVTWAAEHAHGKPTTLENYLTTHPLKLE